MYSVSERRNSLPLFKVNNEDNTEELENRFGFLATNTPRGKFRRVSEYVSDEKTKQLISQVLPTECCKGVAITVGLTGGGVMLGIGVGGLAGGPPGAFAGGVIGGVGGFALGTYYHFKSIINLGNQN
jgi:hypothetical protein